MRENTGTVPNGIINIYGIINRLPKAKRYADLRSKTVKT